MAELNTVHAAQPAMFTEAQQLSGEHHEEYTPGDFLRECSTVVAACLGVAALGHLVVSMIGN